MWMEIIKKEWNGFAIEFEDVNGQLMANATSMCAAFGKEPYNWLKRKDTKELVAELETDRQRDGRFVETRNTGTSGAGTWIHESLILDLAQWLNVKFKVKCQQWIAELLRTGKVELKPLTDLQKLKMLVDNAVELEARQAVLEAEVVVVKQELVEVKSDVEQLAHTIVNQVHELNHFTVAGYFSQHKRPAPHNKVLQQLGKQAVALSNAQAVPISTAPHEKYGSVKVYRDDILRQVLGF